MTTALSSFIKSPQKIFFESQERNEQIIFFLRKDFVVNVPWIFFGVLLFLFPILFNLVSQSSFFFVLPEKYRLIGSLAWYLISLAFILENYLLWYFNVYLITDRRIVDIDFFGLFNKRISEAPLENIEDVTYSMNGIVQTIFNYGNVYIQTAAEMREFEFQNVSNPALIHDKLTDLVGRKRAISGHPRKNRREAPFK